MSSALLESLRELVEDDLDGVAATPDGLRAVADARWGEVTISVDLEEDEQDADGTAALRVSVSIPPPAGAGQEFLVWCLATNTQYWGVKIGLLDDGMLQVHADLETEGDQADDVLASDVVDRAETILQLIDEDLTDYCLAHALGTPVQRTRWESRRPEVLEE